MLIDTELRDEIKCINFILRGSPEMLIAISFQQKLSRQNITHQITITKLIYQSFIDLC